MIKNLWRLHLGLTKYIIKELPKRKTSKEVIGFLKSLLGVYLQELLKMYKSLFLVFDKNYREQKKQYDKMQKIKVDLQRCLKMLQYVDQKMAKTGISRQRRRQFWRDFYSRGEVRKETFDQLLNEISQIR